MSGKVFLSLLLLSSLLLPIRGQQPQPSPPTAPTAPQVDAQDVVRITTNLVQVDAVVTQDGKQVTDLKPEDFEVFEDGKPQTITHFSYISNVPTLAPAKAVTSTKSKDRIAPPVLPARINANDQRRTVALVIDDLGISFESMSRLRAQIRKFLDDLSPNDLVAILHTSGDVGSLQQFTNDRRVLQNALDHLRWNPWSRAGLYVFPRAGAIDDNTSIGSQYVLGGTLNALHFILKGMSYLPGRKSMVVFSDVLPIEDQESNLFGQSRLRAQVQSESESQGQETPAFPDSGIGYYGQLQRIAELAIRSSVVIYSVDTRGLQTTGLTAADRLTSTTQAGLNNEISSLIRSRSDLMLRGREGSDLIARQSGGFLVRNSNDFGLKSVMEDQQGYYLIGFRPTEETFDRKFHHIKARLKRRGLTVRTRAGFYGFTDEEVRPKELTTTDLMNKALISPFGAKEIDVRLTSFFLDDPAKGALLRSFVYLDPHDLTFAEQPDGWRVATLDVRAVIFGDNGRVLTEQDQTGTLRLRGTAYERALREGIAYSFDVPSKLRGVFQFRVAVRDLATAHIGAAGQFVEIPNLRNGRMVLSGVVAREDGDMTAATPLPNEHSDIVSTGPAVRRFPQGSSLTFAYAIYNAGAGRRPLQLTRQLRLFRDGKIVFTGASAAVTLDGQSDLQRLMTSSRLQFGSVLTPGDYILQVIVTDSTDEQKPRVASQWIDFEVVK